MSENDPILVVNGVESRLQIVLGGADGILCSHEITAPGRIMPFLAPTIDWMCRGLDIDLDDLKGIAAVRGPGSFTGVRLVLATMLGLARGKNLPMAGIDYPVLLADAPAQLLDGELWVCTYARFRQVYVQGFSCPGGIPLNEPVAASWDDAVERIASRQGRISLLGSGLRKDEGWWAGQVPAARILPDCWDHPSPQNLLDQALAAEYSATAISPLYIRVSDAEKNLATIASDRGLTESEARSHIPDFLNQE